ncbi:unnamed protein product [Soboliphyme baturini]|uniref:GDP-mannose 4,6-dehydratase n=1 Tax=Soboliphyme baturini TaxID=241478 RepID=A0A183IX39_9BILA|nr:unnamed protein product [Soboliphyme baturini]
MNKPDGILVFLHQNRGLMQFGHISNFVDDIKLHRIDWKNRLELEAVLKRVQPDEVYHLASSSNVKQSYWFAEDSLDSIYLNTLRMLDGILNCVQKDVKFFHPSSGEMFGSVLTGEINEDTPFRPCSPYAISKACAHWIVATYRETHDLFACNGIMFNHESPRRDKTFVTRKITDAVAKIFVGKQQLLELGNLDAFKDWGHSRDYTEAMWRMLQRGEPDDYVIATGESHTVREFVHEAFRFAGVDIR